MSKKTEGPPTEAKQWLKLFESSALYKHEPSRLFEDYLDLVLCCLANQQQEARYLEVAGRYTREELENISHLWAYHLMIHEHQVAARGWYDMLGDIYMDMAGRSKTSRMGQFFTPTEVCTVIAQLQFGDPEEARGKTCLDPCVGSGRMLLAMHSIQPDLGIVVGADLDRICAKMCAVNFWLHGIRGEVAHMNTLSQEWYFAWQTHPRATWPFVTFLDEDRKLESVLYQERHQLPQAPVKPAVQDLFSQAEEPEPSWNKPKYEPKTCRWHRQQLQHERPGVVFLFRHGNEYEVFGVDAKTVAAEFGLELRRTEHLVPVVVFSWEALSDVLPWLVRSGERVAIVDPDSAEAPWEDSAVAEDREVYGSDAVLYRLGHDRELSQQQLFAIAMDQPRLIHLLAQSMRHIHTHHGVTEFTLEIHAYLREHGHLDPITQHEFVRLNGSRCPSCLSDDLEGGSFTDDGEVTRETTCRSCGQVFAEHHSVSGYNLMKRA